MTAIEESNLEIAQLKETLAERDAQLAGVITILSRQDSEARGLRLLDETASKFTACAAIDSGLAAMASDRLTEIKRLYGLQLDLDASGITGDAAAPLSKGIAKCLRSACMHLVAIGTAAQQPLVHKRYKFLHAYVLHASDSALAEPEVPFAIGEFASLLRINTTARTEAEKAAKSAEEPTSQSGNKRQGGSGGGPQQGKGWSPMGPMKRAFDKLE